MLLMKIPMWWMTEGRFRVRSRRKSLLIPVAKARRTRCINPAESSEVECSDANLQFGFSSAWLVGNCGPVPGLTPVSGPLTAKESYGTASCSGAHLFTPGGRAGLVRCDKLLSVRSPAQLLPSAFPGKSLFDASLGSGFQIERVPLDFADDVFRLNFSLEPAQRIVNGLALLQSNFCQCVPPLGSALELSPCPIIHIRLLTRQPPPCGDAAPHRKALNAGLKTRYRTHGLIL